MGMITALTKQGEDVLYELAQDPIDPNKFILLSDKNTFKLVAQGMIDTTLGQSAMTELSYDFPHGLDYRPFVLGYCIYNGKAYLPGSVLLYGTYDYQITIFSGLFVDDDNIYFTYGNMRPSIDVQFKFFITEVPL